MTTDISHQTINSFNKLVDLFTNDFCANLARQLHIKTGLPIYAIYDSSEQMQSWGVDYWHYFVKVTDDCYLNAQGLHTEAEMIAYWANAWEDDSLLTTSRIMQKEPEFFPIDDDPYIEMMGAGRTIHPHTIEFADAIISTYL
jgi:hypothetical protein